MLLQLSEKVDVIAIYKKEFLPIKFRWKNREYKIVKLGYHHKIKLGNVTHHIFSGVTHNLAFRLNLDTENLSWTLEEISDGLPD